MLNNDKLFQIKRREKMKKTFILTIFLASILCSLQDSVLLAIACNGKQQFCDRKFNEVAQVRVHNATSIKKDKFMGMKNPVADQNIDLAEQLKRGFRAFKIPVHPNPTDGTAWVNHTMSAREANENAKKIPFFALIKDKLWDLDASKQPLTKVLAQIKEFLDNNPYEVITLFLNMFADAEMPSIDAFDKTGLKEYMHGQKLNEPWPTLQELINNKTRLIVFSDRGMQYANIDWTSKFLNVSDYFFNNTYSFLTPDDLANNGCQLDGSSSEKNLKVRNQSPRNKMCDLTHFVTPGIAGDPKKAAIVNSYEFLMNHIKKCKQAWNIGDDEFFPTFISLDFVDEKFDDIMRVIDELNKPKTQTEMPAPEISAM
jgi:hypothetical protein